MSTWNDDFNLSISHLLRDGLTLVESLTSNPVQQRAACQRMRRIIYDHMDILRNSLVDKHGFPLPEKRVE